jgi:DNA-binding transcriptional regulator YiaG
LRDWEQKRRLPDTASIAYLRVIRHNPQSVLDALTLDR